MARRPRLPFLILARDGQQLREYWNPKQLCYAKHPLLTIAEAFFEGVDFFTLGTKHTQQLHNESDPAQALTATFQTIGQGAAFIAISAAGKAVLTTYCFAGLNKLAETQALTAMAKTFRRRHAETWHDPRVIQTSRPVVYVVDWQSDEGEPSSSVDRARQAAWQLPAPMAGCYLRAFDKDAAIMG